MTCRGYKQVMIFHVSTTNTYIVFIVQTVVVLPIYIYYLNSCTMTSGMFMYSNGTCKVEWYADIGDWWMHLRPMIRRQDVLL